MCIPGLDSPGPKYAKCSQYNPAVYTNIMGEIDIDYVSVNGVLKRRHSEMKHKCVKAVPFSEL